MHDGSGDVPSWCCLPSPNSAALPCATVAGQLLTAVHAVDNRTNSDDGGRDGSVQGEGWSRTRITDRKECSYNVCSDVVEFWNADSACLQFAFATNARGFLRNIDQGDSR